jgi:choline dehydrogenase
MRLSIIMASQPDYDDWAAAGNPGWDYHAIKPVYDGFEDIIRTDKQPVRMGKLTVSDVADENHPLKSYFFAMANEMGLAKRSCLSIG